MIGTTLGSYRILRELGMGGMGVVYYAEHPMLGKRVAIKLLRPELSHNTEIVGRFFNEAKAVTTINHPGLVDIYDFGYAPDGSAYIVMEFLEGESLASRLRRERPLPTELVIALARQLTGALGAAHALKIVHRDLKPDNIFLSPDPDVPLGIRAKVLDFGIAKLAPGLGGDDSNPHTPHTRTGMMMGTPSYMAPEQCKGAKEVDSRADIYALGCILYEMMTGRVPFDGEGIGEVIAKHQYEPPPAPSSLAPGIPPHLEALILRMLEKKPDARPQTVEQVAATLDPSARPSALGPAVAPPSASMAVPAVTTLSGAAGQPTVARRGRAGLVIGIGAVVIAVIVTIVVAGGGGGGETLATAGSARPQPAPEPPKPVVAAKAPADPPAKPMKITLAIESVPPGAEVFRVLDGVRVGKTPFRQQIDRVDGQALYLVKLAGHKDEKVELDTASDSTRTVKLVPIVRPSGPIPTPIPTGPQAVDPFEKRGSKK